jgi:hypothetical protein
MQGRAGEHNKLVTIMYLLRPPRNFVLARPHACGHHFVCNQRKILFSNNILCCCCRASRPKDDVKEEDALFSLKMLK